MLDYKYKLSKVKSKIFKNKEMTNNFFRKQGMKIGERCNICSNISTPESFLIEIKNNVTIGANVEFVTHDNSISKVIEDATDIFGRIKIGNNCFIGARSVVMYGVELADNIIVASGSIVTKSFHENNIIIGGNPAKKISDWNVFKEKNINKYYNLNKIDKKDLSKIISNDESKLIKR